MSIRNKFLNLRINPKKSDETMADAINSVAEDFDRNPDDVMITGGLLAIAMVVVGLFSGLCIGAMCLALHWVLDVPALTILYAYMVVLVMKPTITLGVKYAVKKHLEKKKANPADFDNKIM